MLALQNPWSTAKQTIDRDDSKQEKYLNLFINHDNKL